MNILLKIAIGLGFLGVAACTETAVTSPTQEQGIVLKIAESKKEDSVAVNEPRATSQLRSVRATALPKRSLILLGMERENVRLLLGAPQMARHEPPAEVWQYRGRDCVLNVFFYKGKNAQTTAQVEHVEMMPLTEDAQVAAGDNCIDSMVMRRAQAAIR